MRPCVLPGLQKSGAKRSHRREMYSVAWVLVIQRSSEVMMSGSACEARIADSLLGGK